MSVKLLLLITFALFVEISYQSTNKSLYGTNVNRRKSYPYIKWIEELVFQLPSQTLDIGVGTIVLYALKCTNTSIDKIESFVIKPLGLRLYVDDIAATCLGLWNVTSGFLEDNGHVKIKVKRSSAILELNLSVNETTGLADSASLGRNNIKINVQKIDLTDKFGLPWGTTIPSLLKSLLNDLLSAFAEFKAQNIVESQLNDLLSKIALNSLPYLKNEPNEPTPPMPPGMVNFKKQNNELKLLDYILNDIVGARGVLGLNDLVNRFTNNTGEIFLDNLGVNVNLHIKLPVSSSFNISVTLKDIRMKGLNSWTDIDVLTPSKFGNYSLGSVASIDTFSVYVTYNVTFSVFSGLGSAHKIRKLIEEGVVKASFHNSSVKGMMVYGLEEHALNSLSPAQLFLHPVCLLSNIRLLNLTQLIFNTTIENLLISAPSSPPFVREFDELLTNVVSWITSTYSKALGGLINGEVMDKIRLQLNSQLETQVATNFTVVKKQLKKLFPPNSGSFLGELDFSSCPSNPPPLGDLNFVLAKWVSIAVGCIVLLMLVMYVVLDRRQNKYHSEKANVTTPLLNEKSDLESAPFVDEKEKSMHFQKGPVHSFVVGMLFLLNLSIFIVGDFSLGASISYLFTIGERHYHLPPVYSLSLFSFTRDAWNGEAYAIGVGIGALSLTFPYIRLMFLAICWYLPRSFLSIPYREILLDVSSFLGKLTFVYPFVLGFLMVAFQNTIVSPISPSDYIHVVVTPGVGFYMFVFSSLISILLNSHLLIVHRSVVLHSTSRKRHSSGTTGETCIINPGDMSSDSSTMGDSEEFPDESSCENDRTRLKNGEVGSAGIVSTMNNVTTNSLMDYFPADSLVSRDNEFGVVFFLQLLLGLFPIPLIVIGALFPSLTYNYKGAVGALEKFLKLSTTQPYSLVRLGIEIPYSTLSPNDFFVRILQAFFWLVTLAIPILLTLALLSLWLFTSRKWRSTGLLVCEHLDSFSGLEAYVVSVMLCVLQLRSLSSYLLKEHLCGMFNILLRKYFAKGLQNDPICMDVVTGYSSGWFVLLAGVVLLFLKYQILLRKTRKIIHVDTTTP